jgi:metal-sulfur cluster biosynthetic enzyme
MTMPTVLTTDRSLDVGLPGRISTHKSGGRDLWTGPLKELPADCLNATWAALDEVLDPELPISLVELGLIYDVELIDEMAIVQVTFTSTACPCIEFIREDLIDRLEIEPWIEKVEIVEVWDPPWTTERVTPAGRAKLGQLGVGV